MKIKELAGLSPVELLQEEESDYYRDYKHGLISYDEYQQLVRQFQDRSGQHHSSSYHQPKMVGMYFYDVKPGQEEDAQWIGVKKTKSGKWALVQHDTSGATFRHKKHLADLKFGPGKFWSPKKESVSEAGGAQQAAIAIAKKKSGKYDKEGKRLKETATAGATSAANIGTVDAPQLSPGKSRGKRSYLGSPGTGSGKKAPAQPKVVQPKNSDGTAKNGLDIKASLFGQAKESVVIKRR
jgi:hypothetical protein